MIIETTRFGQLEYQEEEVITFANGIPGFKEYKRYTLVMIEDSPFMYLQSVEGGALAFIVVTPFEFYQEYAFDLPEVIKTELGIEWSDNVQVVNIVNIRDDLATATINLAAPIILNLVNKNGLQYILPEGAYSIHQPLFANRTASTAGGE